MTFRRQGACLGCLAMALVVAVLAGLAFLYSGWYPMGADRPHNAVTYWALETLRERAITRASADIPLPADLDNPARLLAGAADYNDMCTGCHLRPGLTESDFTLGLYPAPPDLTQAHHHGDEQSEARRRFWIIKHGIKASGMPAWGPRHDDERIWNMVAFLSRLPELTPEQYRALSARGEEDGHDHQH
ncbi:cytochrome c [Gallaecimonas sp. GXIMD4217]|uniref:c-type cytochrome n=1 Tax=Gallaecimonas sp. GXIMD4217 TaxID=3131927 RepID=UPI00311AC1C2